ncbi:DUF4214 domain-containing protein [Aquihabitans sp. McL0605]|uniref:DUF4214 domain-containing protein n=1 Tax=Aquihabitans sp. McL0605 TaxID=3415671 RepID=UPI003CE92CDC
MNKTTALRGVGLALLTSLTALALPASPAGATTGKAPVNGLISVATNDHTGNKDSTSSDLSGLGRFVAFNSDASDLVAGDSNGIGDVFVRSTLSETTTRVSVSSHDVQGNGLSDQAAISYNGRWVVFRSLATNLVPGDTNGKADIFLRDLQLKTTVRVSLTNNGAHQLTGGDSAHPSISYDGKQVLFQSDATNVVDWDLNNATDIFVRDLTAGATEIESVTSADAALTSPSDYPAFSGDGRYVVFGSNTTQVGVDTNGHKDVFLRDRQLGTTEKVSTASNGDQSDGDSYWPSVSDNGRFITFQSLATDLTPAVDAPSYDVFRRDRTLATTVLVSRNTAGQPANTGGWDPDMSADGLKVTFTSGATNLVSGDTNGVTDTFVRDLAASTTVRTSTTSSGGQLNSYTILPSISPDGTAAGYATASELGYDQQGSSNLDVYVRASNELGPFANTTGLIQRNLIDFTGTAPTIGQIVGLNNRVLYGVASSESTINGLAHGTFDDHRGPIMRLYWAFFLRMPDLNGLDYWSAKEAGPTTLRQIANSFAKSSEFKTKYGQLSNSAFVTLVYQSVLERNPDAAGLAHWVAELGNGVSRGEMMVGFSESSEGVRRMRGEVDTVLVSLGMLHRLPSKGEFNGYVALLEVSGGQPTEVLISNILTSAEYANVVVK